MTTTDETLQRMQEEDALKLAYAQAEHQVQLAQDLATLEKSPEFQRLIRTAFLDRAMKDHVRMSTRMTSADNREMNHRCLFAIGFFEDWLDTIEAQGEQGKAMLEELHSQDNNAEIEE